MSSAVHANDINVDTNAYNSQLIVYPVIDGRIFVRGGNGVYCYDLRTQYVCTSKGSRSLNATITTRFNC